jgi:radical SAM superfamily enzyme YgiQ (UPF0313 family)
MSAPDVLLVRPWAPSAVPADALVEDSLGVGYLASGLRQASFTTAVLDAFTLGLSDSQIVDCIAALRPRMLGISLHSFADYRHAITIAEGVKSRFPATYCVLGGEHATFLAREVLNKHSAIDAVILGEGDHSTVELAQSVLRMNKLPSHVTGAITRDQSGKLVDGGFREAIGNLDELPLPSKDIVELAISLNRSVALSILTGRGCTHKCTFEIRKALFSLP